MTSKFQIGDTVDVKWGRAVIRGEIIKKHKRSGWWVVQYGPTPRHSVTGEGPSHMTKVEAAK